MRCDSTDLCETCPDAAPAVPVVHPEPEAGEAQVESPVVWLPGMLATIWWAVDGGPIGVSHAMRRDDDWVACGDVAVPDEYVIWAVRIIPPDVEQRLPPGGLVQALLEAVEADFELNGHAANAAAIALRDYIDATDDPAPAVPVGVPGAVHNHGSEEGPGLACNEAVVDGELRGACLSVREDQ